MEEVKKDNTFNLRLLVIGIIVLLIIASQVAIGATAYKLGREHGYNQLEREIVYALALSKSKHVGKFLVAKLDDGGTIIALNEHPFAE